METRYIVSLPSWTILAVQLERGSTRRIAAAMAAAVAVSADRRARRLIAAGFLVVAVFDGSALLAILAATLFGALAGFAPYNFAPARVYLGDSGSMFLGLTLGGISLAGAYTAASPWGLAAPLLIQDIHSWTRQGIGGLQSMVLYALPELDGAIDPITEQLAALKESGIGKEGGSQGLEDYFDTKYTAIAGL